MEPIRALRERAPSPSNRWRGPEARPSPPSRRMRRGERAPRCIRCSGSLQRLAAAVGLHATIEYSAPLTREERRSLALHRAIARRLADDPAAVIAQARRNLARMRRRHGQATNLLREWNVILDRPVPALAALLTSTAEWVRELRHVTPFAGVLSAAERAGVYREFSRNSTDAA